MASIGRLSLRRIAPLRKSKKGSAASTSSFRIGMSSGEVAGAVGFVDDHTVLVELAF
jgi:hypothetical protein